MQKSRGKSSLLMCAKRGGGGGRDGQLMKQKEKTGRPSKNKQSLGGNKSTKLQYKQGVTRTASQKEA